MKLPTAEEMFEETVQKVSSSPEEEGGIVQGGKSRITLFISKTLYQMQSGDCFFKSVVLAGLCLYCQGHFVQIDMA